MSNEKEEREVLPSIGAADPADVALQTSDFYLQLAMKAQKETPRHGAIAWAKGVCNNPACKDELENPNQLYCDGKCADEHDRIEKRRAR